MILRGRQRRPKGLMAALALALLGLGVDCVPEFDPASKLGDSPQILGVRVDPPVAIPGDVVRIDALLHWPGAQPPEQHWILCQPLGFGWPSDCVADALTVLGTPEAPATLAEVPDCLLAPDSPVCILGQGSQLTLPIPDVEIPTDLPEGVNPFFYVQLVAADPALGLAGCAEAVETVYPTDQCLIAVKRVEFTVASTPAADRNVNPWLVDVTIDDLPVSRDATAPLVLGSTDGDLEDRRVTVSLSADGGTVDELMPSAGEPLEWVGLPVAWFADCGSIDESGRLRCDRPDPAGTAPTCRTETATWSPQMSGDCTVHIVLRDNRGGVDWVSVEVTVP